ncbi:MAG: DUF2182 domain-containing protein [Actinomycetota bacterium]
MTIATQASSRAAPLPRIIPGAIGLAWFVAVAAEVSGGSSLAHHDTLLEGGLPWGAALALFILAWQLMIVAMMLPSSLPLIRMFVAAAADQPRPRAVVGFFLGAYALVWGAFGLIAFAGDAILHRVVEANPRLDANAWVVSAGVLALAGAFQFSSLKDRCLRECRHPGVFLLQHYRRGTRNALRLGIRHGLFCLGCCWALMLVSFAVGVANLWWMAVLTALMVYEKTGRKSAEVTTAAGAALLAMGATVAVLGLFTH